MLEWQRLRCKGERPDDDQNQPIEGNYDESTQLRPGAEEDEVVMTNYQEAQSALRELTHVNAHTALPWAVALAARAIGHAVLELAAALRSGASGGQR